MEVAAEGQLIKHSYNLCLYGFNLYSVADVFYDPPMLRKIFGMNCTRKSRDFEVPDEALPADR
jgi:hypothetical protein